MTPTSVRVRDVMTKDVVSLEEDLTLPLADWVMREKHIRHLPVVDAERRLVGLVTHRTMLAAKSSNDDGWVFPVADIMVKNPVVVSADDTAADTARFMVENRIGCAMVTDDDDRIIGIVTEADFVELAARMLFRVPRIAVDDFMTSDLVTLSEDEPLELADLLMASGRFRHLPVIDGGGHLVGLITHRDLLKTRLRPHGPQRVADVAQRDVWSIASGSSARNAARTLADHAFGCLPVTRDGRLVGLITEADVLQLLVRLLARAGAFRRPNPPLRYYMSAPVHCVGIDTSLERARQSLSRRLISALGVVSDTNHLVGIITATDLVGETDGAEGVVADHMTRDVVTIGVDAPMSDAARTLIDHQIHRVFVTEDDRLAGVVSTADVVLSVRDMRVHTPLSELMSPLVMTIGPGESVEAARRFLESAEIRALIVTEQSWPIGVLDQRHLLSPRAKLADAVVEDVMSSAVIALPTDAAAFRAAAQMAHLGVDHVVTIAKGEPVGVVTGMDMARLCSRAGSIGSTHEVS